jgi:signal transduction histidine kinase
MLYEFLEFHRETLVSRCKATVAARRAPEAVPTHAQAGNGIPVFLNQLIRTLLIDSTPGAAGSLAVSGSAGGEGRPSEITATAGLHGLDLLLLGYSVGEVVHDYGDLCQAITGLAVDMGYVVTMEEFRTLNRCLDNGIAEAVSAYTLRNSLQMQEGDAQRANEQLGIYSHELRNQLHTATLAVAAIRTGKVALAGATGAVLDRSLQGMRDLIDLSLTGVRSTAGLPQHREVFSLADFISEAALAASFEAHKRECLFSVTSVDRALGIEGDRATLLSALRNLLQNAFKFTRHRTEVTLSAYAADERVRIDVLDHCGGLPHGASEKMFEPFTQMGADKSGLGLGLSSGRQTVEANEGTLHVTDIPGSGCMFSIDMPRRTMG